jgi:hypothetical protein
MALHIVITAFSIATALASGFAAWFWSKSSLQDTNIVEETQASISDAQELHILDAKVGIGAFFPFTLERSEGKNVPTGRRGRTSAAMVGGRSDGRVQVTNAHYRLARRRCLPERPEKASSLGRPPERHEVDKGCA